MTLLDTIKSVLGIDDRDTRDERRNDDRGGVTVEREPDDQGTETAPETGSEDAVKGTDTDRTDEPDGEEPAASGSDAAGSTESMIDESAEGGAEPGEVTSPGTGGGDDAVGTAEEADATEAAGTDTTTDVHESDPVADDASDVTADAEESAAAGGDATGSTGSITEETNESISAAEDAEATGPTGAEPGDTADHDVDVLKGIGPSYAEQLESAGIETVADLADADSTALADETDISESRIERWTERAKARRQ